MSYILENILQDYKMYTRYSFFSVYENLDERIYERNLFLNYDMSYRLVVLPHTMQL